MNDLADQGNGEAQRADAAILEPPVLLQPTLVRYKVLAWMCALSMITYIDRVCIKQVGGDMQTALGVTEQDFAWVFSAFGLAYALFEVPSGWLGDKLGARKVLIRVVLWWSFFTAATGWASTRPRACCSLAHRAPARR